MIVYVKFGQHCLRGLAAPPFRYFRVSRCQVAASHHFVPATVSVRQLRSLPLSFPRSLRALSGHQSPFHVGEIRWQFRCSPTAPPRSDAAVLLRFPSRSALRLSSFAHIAANASSLFRPATPHAQMRGHVRYVVFPCAGDWGACARFGGIGLAVSFSIVCASLILG